MFSLVKWLLILLLCLGAIGFYLGWFSLSSPKPDVDGNKVNVNVSVDKGKIKADVKKVKEKIKEEVKELKGTAKASEPKASEPKASANGQRAKKPTRRSRCCCAIARRSSVYCGRLSQGRRTGQGLWL